MIEAFGSVCQWAPIWVVFHNADWLCCSSRHRWSIVPLILALGPQSASCLHSLHHASSYSWASLLLLYPVKTLAICIKIRLASETKLELLSLNYKQYVRIRGSVIISVRERKFQGTKVPGNESSMNRMDAPANTCASSCYSFVENRPQNASRNFNN